MDKFLLGLIAGLLLYPILAWLFKAKKKCQPIRSSIDLDKPMLSKEERALNKQIEQFEWIARCAEQAGHEKGAKTS